MLFFNDYIMKDHVDLHSGRGRNYSLPAEWVTRDHCDMAALTKVGK